MTNQKKIVTKFTKFSAKCTWKIRKKIREIDSTNLKESRIQPTKAQYRKNFKLTITRLPVSVRWSFVSVRVLMTVSVLLRILVSISVSVIQRADSGWPSPSVFFDVIVFGWNGIITVFDIQGLFFVIFLSISIFTDFFDGIINVAGVVLRSVGFFVSIRTAAMKKKILETLGLYKYLVLLKKVFSEIGEFYADKTNNLA